MRPTGDVNHGTVADAIAENNYNCHINKFFYTVEVFGVFGIWRYPVYTLAYIRQPEDKATIVERLHVQNCCKVMQRQWRRSLYDPSRQLCRGRLTAEFDQIRNELPV